MSSSDVAFTACLIAHLALAALLMRAFGWKMTELVCRTTIPAIVLAVFTLLSVYPPEGSEPSALVAAVLGIIGGGFILVVGSLFAFWSELADRPKDY